MAVTSDTLKAAGVDYLLARYENDELVMEPTCACGRALEEDYFCAECNRECDCAFIACEDPQALTIVEKLVSGNPSFKNYKVSLFQK